MFSKKKNALLREMAKWSQQHKYEVDSISYEASTVLRERCRPATKLIAYMNDIENWDTGIMKELKGWAD